MHSPIRVTGRKGDALYGQEGCRGEKMCAKIILWWILFSQQVEKGSSAENKDERRDVGNLKKEQMKTLFLSLRLNN